MMWRQESVPEYKKKKKNAHCGYDYIGQMNAYGNDMQKWEWSYNK